MWIASRQHRVGFWEDAERDKARCVWNPTATGHPAQLQGDDLRVHKVVPDGVQGHDREHWRGGLTSYHVVLQRNCIHFAQRTSATA